MLAAPILLPLMVLAAADSGATRQGYSTCVNTQMKAALTEKLTPDAFTAKTKTACAAPEKAFRDAIISENKADGLPAAAAKADAEDQVTELQNRTLELYKYHQETNTMPG